MIFQPKPRIVSSGSCSSEQSLARRRRMATGTASDRLALDMPQIEVSSSSRATGEPERAMSNSKTVTSRCVRRWVVPPTVAVRSLRSSMHPGSEMVTPRLYPVAARDPREQSRQVQSIGARSPSNRPILNAEKCRVSMATRHKTLHFPHLSDRQPRSPQAAYRSGGRTTTILSR